MLVRVILGFSHPDSDAVRVPGEERGSEGDRALAADLRVTARLDCSLTPLTPELFERRDVRCD